MKPYDHKTIEEKWQKEWEESGIYEAKDDSSKPKFYGLIEFPFPSGEGLHVGHIRSNTAMDIIVRKRRMEGYNALYPIGWDAFGLPTENYAIKTGKQPSVVTRENTDTFRRQLKSLGFSFDWSREINTTDPEYYRWTQWIFLKFLEAGLAYKARIPINWCPKDKIGLANEEVVGGLCERCGTPVEKREKEQWMLAITKYADRLDKDLDEVDYLEKIKIQQRNWIGKSEGAEISFQLSASRFQDVQEAKSSKLEAIIVFTTRPDTILGATYVVLSPEHPWVTLAIDDDHKGVLHNSDEVKAYVQKARGKSDIDRTAEGREKTGVELKGIKAINPATKEEIPVWVADYVLPHYGTGAIMAVPADDKRDREFAETFSLPIVENYQSAGFEEYGKKVTKYKLRDWVFSRQRYWGEPIPVIHCDKCGAEPVPEKDLPVRLPEVDRYEPTDDGESPLSAVSSWVNVPCPKCGGPGKRETDTMPQWAGSSWYFLRYIDPDNKEAFASKEALQRWMPVDWYNGGMEHTTLHLLYSRFWHKFLFDLGLVPTSEPYKKRTSQGLILAEGGEKMSKSKGNVVSPDGIVDLYGADTLRLYEMFMGPFDQHVVWSTESIIGPRRFIERAWKIGQSLFEKAPEMADDELDRLLHRSIHSISKDIETMSFNTAVSAMMVFINAAEKQVPTKDQFGTFLILLHPFAPFVTEELWSLLGNKTSIQYASWPKADEEKLMSPETTVVVQVDGKVRASLKGQRGEEEEAVVRRVKELPELEKWLADKRIKKVIFIKDRLVNFVLES